MLVYLDLGHTALALTDLDRPILFGPDYVNSFAA